MVNNLIFLDPSLNKKSLQLKKEKHPINQDFFVYFYSAFIHVAIPIQLACLSI